LYCNKRNVEDEERKKGVVRYNEGKECGATRKRKQCKSDAAAIESVNAKATRKQCQTTRKQIRNEKQREGNAKATRRQRESNVIITQKQREYNLDAT
jgi:hypothetical protein